MKKYKKSDLAKWRDNFLFGGNRIKALERDGYKCVICSMSNKEHKIRFGRSITVDHIDGNGCGKPKQEKNNDLSNLQTLCLSCHVRKDSKVIKNIRPWTHCKMCNKHFPMANSKRIFCSRNCMMKHRWAFKKEGRYTSNFSGVYFSNRSKKYVATMRVDGKKKQIGKFNTASEANKSLIRAKKLQESVK